MPQFPCPRTLIDNEDSKHCVAGEMTIELEEDCEGDTGVINGLNYFMTGDITEATCECLLTDEEYDKLIDDAVANYKYGDTAP